MYNVKKFFDILGWTDEQKQKRREEMAVRKARKNYFNRVSVKIIGSNTKQPKNQHNQQGTSSWEDSDDEEKARTSRKRVRQFSFSNPSSTDTKALKKNSAQTSKYQAAKSGSDSEWSDDNNQPESTNNIPLQKPSTSKVSSSSSSDESSNEAQDFLDVNEEVLNELTRGDLDDIPDFEDHDDPIPTVRKSISSGKKSFSPPKKSSLGLSDVRASTSSSSSVAFDRESNGQKRSKDKEVLKQSQLEPKQLLSNLQKPSRPNSKCDHSPYDRKILALQKENERLTKENSKMSDSYQNLKKIRNLLISKILLASSEDEMEEAELVKLEIGPLFSRFEKTYTSPGTANSHEMKILLSRLEKLERNESNKGQSNNGSITPEALEKIMSNLTKTHEIQKKKSEMELKDIKEKYEESNGKLFLQYQIRDNLETQQRELFDILNIPEEDRSFSKLKQTMLELKNSYVEMKETIEHINMS